MPSAGPLTAVGFEFGAAYALIADDRLALRFSRRHYVRVLQTAGAILIAAGLFIIIRPPSYSREESVFKLGALEAKIQPQHSVPGWVGGIALGAGLVLVVLGLKKR